MKRLYTLLLSGLVLAASASVAVPTAMRHIGKAANYRVELSERATTKQVRTLAPELKKTFQGTGMAASENALAFTHKMSGKNIKQLKTIKKQALSSKLEATTSSNVLKAPRKAPEAIADYTGTYTFACTWALTSGAAPATLTITVTDEATGAAEVTGLLPYFSTPLSANFDLAAGTLSILNKQLLGQDEDGNVYFYLKSIDEDYNFIDGASDAAATVGTISGSLITFPQFDIWAIGDYDNEDLGFYYLSYNNRMQLAEPEDPNKDPNEGWTSLGNATFMDGWILPALGIDQTERENWYEVELQQNDENKAVYRLVNPYKGNCPVAVINESTKNGYIQFDITDPDHVVFANLDAGFVASAAGITEFYPSNYLSYFVNAGYPVATVLEQLGDAIPYTTYKDGVLSLGYIMDDGNLINDAGFGTQDRKNSHTSWKDGDGNTANMSAAVYFPGTPLPTEPIDESFTVYANGEMDKELNLNPWWNVTLDSQAENPAGDGKVLSSTHTGDLNSNFCFGFQTEKGSTVSGPLHSATLSFQYYATTTCTVTVKLTADKEDEKTVTVADDDVNKWNTVTFNITEDFPNVASEWKNWEKQGDGDAVFSAVVQNYNADTKVYFNNVVYTNLDTKWEKPEVEEPFCPVPLTPTKAAEDVISLLSGAYPMKMGYSPNDWGSGTSYEMLLTDNRVPVVRFGRFNYYGWEFYENIDVTGMDYLHVDFYPMTATGFGVTPISPAVDGGAANEKLYTVAAEDVTAGQWNSLDIPLTYFEGVDFSNLFQMKYAGGNSESTVFMTNVYFYKGEPDTPEPGETLDITGDYIGYLNDCYFDDSIGNLEEDVTITQEGTDVTINSDYFLSPIKATIDPATGVITFDNNGFVGTYTYDGTTFYIELTPHRWIYDDYTTGEGHSSFDSYSVTYNPETHTIEFPDDAGFAWRAYRDQALTTYAGFLDAFDVFKFAWVDPNIDPNEGWTSLGEATFQDGWVLPMFGIDQTDRANWYKVEMQQNDENENVYRLVDPYHGNCPVADYNESEKPGYIQFDVTDPDHVVFATDVKSGFAFSAAALPAMYCYNAYTFYTTEFGLTAEEMSESEPDYQFTTYKDGIVTVPSWTNENGLNNEACFSTSTTLNLYEWQDANYVPAYMEAKIFFPGVDSIRELNAKSEAAPEVYYNLHGQRIAKPTVPGLYIRNNRKVVVR